MGAEHGPTGPTGDAERVEQVAGDALAGSGLAVDDVDITRAGRRRIVRVAVDRDLSGLAPDDTRSTVPGVDLDTVADATRAVGDALDATDVLGDAPYVLEVTTPGVSRPLTLPRHFRRNVGRLVEVTLHEGAPVTGRLVAADEDGATIDVPATKTTPGGERVLRHDEMSRAQVQVEFARDDEQED